MNRKAYCAALLCSLCFLYLSGCQSKAAQDSNEVAPPTEIDPESPTTENQSGEPAPNSEDPVLTNMEDSIHCGSDIDLAGFLDKYTGALEAQAIIYNSEPLSDCSGIFLRVSNAVGEKCPNYVFPDATSVRSSRGLAAWFHEHDNLHLVQDPMAIDAYLRPGAVMFYGQSGKSYTNPTIAEITSSSSGIQHIGVVVEVVKEEASGQVQSYSLFHGRSTGKIASRTDYHERKPSRTGLPPFGNWKQHLVAVGYILTPPKDS